MANKGNGGMIEALNRETLKKLYTREHKSIREIAKIFDFSYFGMLYRCKKYKIKLRPKGKEIIKINKSVLKRLCVKEGKSSGEVAEMFSCSSRTVQKKCKKYGISLQGRRIKGLTKALLYKLYIKEGKPTREIGKIVGCSFDAVRNRCKQFGIPLRNPGSKKIEIDESALRRLYIKERKSMTEIAEIFDCAISTISKRIRQLGLKE